MNQLLDAVRGFIFSLLIYGYGLAIGSEGLKWLACAAASECAVLIYVLGGLR